MKRKIPVLISTLLSVFMMSTKALAVPFGSSLPDSMPSLDKPVDTSDFSEFFESFKTLGTAIMGICAITALIFFVIAMTKLSASAGNDVARAKAIKGVLISGVSLVLFGGATILVGVFYSMLG